MYGATTNVGVSQTQDAIKRLLLAEGATGFGVAEEGQKAVVMWRIHDRSYRMVFNLPNMNDAKFCQTPTGRLRSTRDTIRLHDQAIRAHWRAMLLVIRATLEAVALGVVSIEQAFGSALVLGHGMSVGEVVEAKAASGKLPDSVPMLEGPGA